MPTDLGQRYSLDWRGNPPHMLRADVDLWYRFLEKWGSQFQNLYYDCLLGGPTLTHEQEQDPVYRGHRINLSKRADAIAELKEELWIIEVSSDPALRSIGQLQTYRALWLRDPKISKPEKLVLVASVPNPDLFDAASMYGILIYLISPIQYPFHSSDRSTWAKFSPPKGV